MPGSIRTIDATPQIYDPSESMDSSLEREVGSKQLSIIPQMMPPSPPADVDLQDLPDSLGTRDSSSRSASPAGFSNIAKGGRRITRDIDRGSPGDQAIFSTNKTPEQKRLAKRKSQYYGEVFANRESVSSARERVLRDSRVIADVKTNVIIHDEFTFITDLSSFLSNRYQRSEESIIVSVTHSCCMLYGGNFDPAYILNITALASQLQPVTNKRNATLLARHMEDSLGVEPKRGLIKFNVIAEENYAAGGKTIVGEIEEVEKEQAEQNISLQHNLSRGSKQDRRQSMKSLRNTKTTNLLPTHNESVVNLPTTYENNAPPMPAIPTEPSALDRKAAQAQKIGRRKSLLALLFNKS